MSLQTTIHLNVDFYDKKYILINAKQYDDSSRWISVTCYNQGEILNLNANKHNVYIRYKKADGYGVLNSCRINYRGEALIELTEQMLAADGICYVDLIVVNKGSAIVDIDSGEIIAIDDSSILSTMAFCINVYEASVDNSTIESSYEYDALNEALQKAEADYTEVIQLSKSYAVGNAGGIRENEDNDNSKYYCELAVSSANSADKSETNAQTYMNNAKTYMNNAKASETNAKTSEQNALVSEQNAKTSEVNALNSEEKAKVSESNALVSEQNAKASETNAKTSETNALDSETKAKTSETNSATSEQNAKISETNAQTYMNNAKTYMDNAKTYMDNAKTSETNSATSEANALISENNSKISEENAKISETNTAVSETNAKTSETNAATSEANSLDSANFAKSYAVGNTGTRNGEDEDNAQYYYQLIKNIVIGLDSGFIPMGTISFSELSSAEKATGYVYNINDDFVTDNTFREGDGKSYTAGTNVYYTADGYWDCFGGASSPTATVDEVKNYLGI